MPNDDFHFECPYCHHVEGQVKAGLRDGVQRYRCKNCNHRFSPAPKHRGIAAEIRQQAIELHTTGLSAQEIGRRLGLNPRSIVNWVHAVKDRKSDNSSEPPGADNKIEGSALRQPDGEIVRPTRRATLHDVAALAEVSPSTVSNFLNGKGRMSETTREGIRSAMTQLHFTPNSLVRAIRERKTNILGVVTFGLDELDYYHESMVVALLGGINQVAGARGYNVLLYTALPEDKSASGGTLFLDGKIDGLIWVGLYHGEHRHAYAARAGLPVMSLLTRQDVEGVAYVDVDNVDAIQQVVAHLVEQGHSRIAYAGGTINQTFVDRLQGYRLGLAAAGIPWDSTLVAANKAITYSWIPTGQTYEYEVAIDRWLAMPDRPTAIVLTTDTWGTWVIDYLEKRGVRVPDDMAVTGFDNTVPRWDPATILTTVAQDFREMARLAALGVIDMIDGASYKDCRKLLSGKLIVRASSMRIHSS